MVPIPEIQAICSRGDSSEINNLAAHLIFREPDQKHIGLQIRENLERIFQDAVASKDTNTALALEHHLSTSYLYFNESEEAYKATYGKYSPYMRLLSEAKWGKYEPCSGPRTAFVFQNSPWLAHTKFAAAQAAYMKNPYFVFIGKRNPTTEGVMDNLGIEAAFYDGNLNLEERVPWLNKTLVDANVGTAVWVSTNASAVYFMAPRHCETQVHWGMRFNPLVGSPAFDGHISCFFEKPGVDYVPPVHPLQTTRPAQVKKKPGFWFICMARNEKMLGAYASAVGEILTRCPDAQFAMAGTKPEPHAELQEFFDRLGVTNRVHYLGFVDPQVIFEHDCFLEPFPLGSSLALGLYYDRFPCVSLDADYVPARRGDLGIRSVDEYIDMACAFYRGDDWLTKAYIERCYDFWESEDREQEERAEAFVRKLDQIRERTRAKHEAQQGVS